MNWFNKLQRRFRFGVENLMLYITVSMLAVFLADNFLRAGLSNILYFHRGMILRGEVWRIISFVFVPLNSQLLFFVISLFFYYFIGNSLEQSWGSDKFTFYYLCGIAGNIIAGLLTGFATNVYLNLSLLFAFAQLFPDMQVRLYFVIPIKIKWLAWFNWAFFAWSFITALIRWDLVTCAAILASVLNFFLFFGGDFINGIKAWNRRRKYKGNMNNFWRFQLQLEAGHDSGIYCCNLASCARWGIS